MAPNLKAEQIINRVKASLLQLDEEAKIILFGSRARGTFNAESDWDFLLLTDKLITAMLWQKITAAMLPIELDENISIQVLPKNKKDWETRHSSTPLYRNIQREGVRL